MVTAGSGKSGDCKLLPYVGGQHDSKNVYDVSLYGCEEEYQKRHNELWPEMKTMIHKYGGHNYTISLDRKTNILYGYIEVEDEKLWAESADTPINRKWWDYMAPLMMTNKDNSPVSKDLDMVFHLD